MMMTVFKTLVFMVFIIEVFIRYTADELAYGEEECLPSHHIGWNLISGYILRIYMAHALFEGLFR